MSDITVPEDRLYTKDHEWVRSEGNGVYAVGITEYAQGELGEVVFADLPATGKQVKQSETLCVVESTKAASDVYSPLSGVVQEANTQLQTEPSLINSSSYEKGWMVKIQGGANVEKEIASLMKAGEYQTFLKGH